ncbi:hypothetical protein [Thermorudis peleae]|uniref:hypothetical protein n=1 Tax=Thermorudis peleae TaxID=1382356 RepID=UPI00057026B4|nr:hypothetical protein [Thermorudis peleae]MBX6754731.1 hypothetical protein [Thermorudis peleae]
MVIDPQVSRALETFACALESCLVAVQNLQPDNSDGTVIRLRLRYWQHALADVRQALCITCPEDDTTFSPNSTGESAVEQASPECGDE